MSDPLQQPGSDRLRRFERPTREHAIQAAQTLLRRGERVDMQTVADALGIGRATLYRWVGDRQQLLDQALGGLVADGFEQVATRASGQGLELALNIAARFLIESSTYPPLQQLAQREPTLTLRVLLDAHGRVGQALREGLARTLAQHAPDLAVHPDTIDAMIQIGTAYEWANVAAGYQPQPETMTEAWRAMLTPGTTTHAAGHPDPAGAPSRQDSAPSSAT